MVSKFIQSRIASLSMPVAKELREAVLKRDGYQCLICGSKNDLAVHHCGGDKIDKEWNLATLCSSCHMRLHNLSYERFYSKYFDTPLYWLRVFPLKYFFEIKKAGSCLKWKGDS